MTSLEDAECRRTKERLSNGNSRVSASKSFRNIPRRHTLGGPRSSKEILGMQTSEMDRKREAFLEHLKQKYPHHATAIMGHQERLRDQVRISCHFRSAKLILRFCFLFCFLPILLRYNWPTTLCVYKEYRIVILFIFIIKWLSHKI